MKMIVEVITKPKDAAKDEIGLQSTTFPPTHSFEGNILDDQFRIIERNRKFIIRGVSFETIQMIGSARRIEVIANKTTGIWDYEISNVSQV